MNKNEFIAAVSENKNLGSLNLSKASIETVIDAALVAIAQALKEGEEVRLVGFGNFFVATRAATTGRNPRTGQTIALEASKTPKFRAGKLLKEAVNSKRAKK